jgi:serine/threonine protein kinase
MIQRVFLSQIGTLTKISQGGQGIVYRAPSASTSFAKSMVYKEYKKATLAALDVQALQAMPEFLESSLSYSDGAKLISLAAWPCRIVEDAGKAIGFLMPSIPDVFYIEIWTNKPTPSRVPAEFQHLLNDPQVSAMRFRGTQPTDRQRYELIQEFASGLNFLHEREVCVGDISPKNILYSLQPTPAVYFIDCDAMRVRGISLSPQVETPGWGVPAGEEKATVHSDRYKLGLLALRLLVGNQDTADPARLPASVPVEVRRVITETLSVNPKDRPSLAVWDAVLNRAIPTASTQKPKTAYPPTTAPKPPKTPPPAPKTPKAPKAKKPKPSYGQPASPPPPLLRTPAPVAVHTPTPTKSETLLWVLAGMALVGLVIISAAIFGAQSGEGSSATTTPSYRAPTAAPSANARPVGDLGLDVPMSTPPCDGRGIVILSSATTPGRYAQDISRALAQYSGSSYLLTERTCKSLRARVDGASIYAVYRPGGRTREELCDAVAAAGNKAYGKWLDNTTDPNFIPC